MRRRTRREFLNDLVRTRGGEGTRARVNYEAALVEDVILAKMDADVRSGDFRLFNRYHQLARSIYEEASPTEREHRFADLHQRMFVEWGFDQVVRDVLSEFPLIAERASEVLFLKTLSRYEEGADVVRRTTDLGGDAGSAPRVVLVKVCPKRLSEGTLWERWLRHELMHASDLLDEAFGYRFQARLADTPAQENIVRERYRVLWDITIDGRLTRRGRGTVATKEQRWDEFDRLFTLWEEGKRRDVFERLWNTDQPIHAELLRLAKEAGDGGARAGGICPLCRFPTYAWATEVPHEVAALVRRDFPDWRSEHGLCERCAEFYSLRSARAQGEFHIPQGGIGDEVESA